MIIPTVVNHCAVEQNTRSAIPEKIAYCRRADGRIDLWFKDEGQREWHYDGTTVAPHGDTLIICGNCNDKPTTKPPGTTRVFPLPTNWVAQ